MIPLEKGAPPAPGQYPVRDERFAAELAQRGYVVVPFLDVEEFESVRRVRLEHGPPPDDPRTGFFSDAWTHAASYRHTVNADLLAALGPPLRRLTEHHQVLAVAHLVKWPTGDSAVVPHRDPSFVDERAYRSITVWCPVTATTSRSGALQIVPGSHRGARRTRSHDDRANLVPDALDGPYTDATTVDVPPGSAVVFDHGVIHGSSANTGVGERISIAVLLTPRGAEPEYSFLTDSAVIEVVSVGPEFFLEHPFQDLDVGGILASHVHVRSERVTPAS